MASAPTADSVAQPFDIPDLPTLLEREPDEEEVRGWSTLSPSLRTKAAVRVALMRRWWGDRGDLSADDAAAIAKVSTKRFYQMASAWKKRPGLLAVGAYAAATPDRSTRMHPMVNAALQANVAKVVASNKDRTVEWLRRELEKIVRTRLPKKDEEGVALTIPSPNVVRAVIVREQNRVADMKLLGESVALDCCPVSMRASDGTPYTLFAVIDRGTLRIMGHALGSVEASVAGYALAAASAAGWIAGGEGTRLPWAPATRRADLVVGTDTAACEALFERHDAVEGHFEFGAITNDRRFGSQIRKYVGERVGRVLLRPSWMKQLPPLGESEEVYDDRGAAERVAAEVDLYNETMPLRRGGTSADGPPKALLDFLSMLAG